MMKRKDLETLESKKNSCYNEAVDLYDIILSHLLDEGYADTEQAAEAIMVNMSEDWREDIIIDHFPNCPSGVARPPFFV
jgi:hypothetical protein